MQKTSLTRVITTALALIAGQALHGQSAYFQAVTNLNPAAYWPLNETNPPPAPFASSMVASNSGTLGALGNGYYGAWYQPSGNTWYLTNNILQSNLTSAPLTGETALSCTFSTGSGQYVVVPRTIGGVVNPNVTIVPPMSVEAWVVPHVITSGIYGIVSEGAANLDYGGPNTNNPYWGGPSDPGWAGFFLGQYSTFFAFNFYMTNAQSKANELDSPHTLTANTWYHVVCTFDGTTEVMWLNNVRVASVTHSRNAAGLTYAPDLTTPLMIGSGNDVTAAGGGGDIAYNGIVAEVAIYNQVLPSTSIANHYMAGYGTNSGGGAVSYATVVEGDSPILYYRLGDPQTMTNAGYPSANFPVATNYGTLGASANGVYQPGTTPGQAGPPYAGFGSNTAVALNGFFGAVDVGGGSLPSALNPVGMVPFTVVGWFQGNSADAPARYQDIVGHGSSSYRLYLGENCGENRFNPGPLSPDVGFANPADMNTNHASKNDGNWHMAAGVTDGTNAYMYLDGVLVKSTNTGSAGISIAGSSLDLLLGGDPTFTYASYNGGGTDRTFDGQIAQVAIWNTNLTTAQIQSLFNAAEVPPTILSEPVGATNNQGAALTVTVVVEGSQPIFYQWYNTNGTPVPGQTNENLSYLSVTPAADGSYYLIATNAGGSVTSTVASVLVYGPPAVQTQSQTNLQIYAGSNPFLFVVATGAPPISYQWYSNGVFIASATSSNYTVTNVQISATYTCTLTNFVSSGLVTSSPILLTVLADPTDLYPATVMAAHPLAFFRLDESNGVTAYDYIGGNNGIYTNTYLDYTTSYDPTSDPTEGGAPGFGVLSANNSYVGWVPANINFATPTNVNAEFSIECWLQEYNVLTDAGIVSLGYGNGGEEFALDCGGNDPAHDLRFYVRDAGGAAEGAVSTFSPFLGGAWHYVAAVCDEGNGHVYLYVDGTNAATGTIPVKSGVATSTESLAIGARQEGLGTQYDNQFIGAIDEVAVYNYALTAAQVQTHYFASGIAPSIISISPNNGNETTNSGATAEFTVVASGTPALYYQWYDPNGNPISTNATLLLPNVQQSQQGQYMIVVSNAYGTTPGYANLTVNLGPPQLVQDLTPLTQTVELYAGLDTVSYTIVVSGSQPFSYQWYQDGSKVSGGTNSTYTFTALAGTNTYYVTVTNAETASEAGGNPLQSIMATVIGLPAPQLNPTNYAYRVEISFPGYQGQPLTNFPALITLSSNINGLAYAQFETNGADLRFTDASGTSMLAFEIDEWNDNGSSTIWVQIPLLDGTNIWAYWGNPNDTDIPPASTNVWLDANYEIVYHLKESALPFADSTGQYPATNGIAPTPTQGVVGHGGLFNGTSDFLSPGSVTLSNQFTTYAWVNLDPSANDIKTVWANQLGGYGNNGISWFVDSYQTADRITHFDSGNGAGTGADPTGGTALTTGQWHFMAATWDQVSAKVTNYLDGVINGSGTAVPSFGLTNRVNLGAFLDPVYYWDGSLDEARIQSGAASTNWMTTTYLNMSESSFVSFSTVNLQPPLTIVRSTNGYILSWPASGVVFTLETTTNLAANGIWTPVTTPAPVLTNGIWQQTVQPAAGVHFYRLQGQ